jgi:hypothetical protein
MEPPNLAHDAGARRVRNGALGCGRLLFVFTLVTMAVAGRSTACGDGYQTMSGTVATCAFAVGFHDGPP